MNVSIAIPRTNASTTVLSEVAATILSLSGYPSKASEIIPSELMTVLDSPVSEASNVPTGHRLQQVVLSNEPLRTPDLNGPPCPICMEEPFHIRYCCPTVLKGPDAIRERLEELQRTDMGDQQSLIKQLEGLLRDSKG